VLRSHRRSLAASVIDLRHHELVALRRRDVELLCWLGDDLSLFTRLDRAEVRAFLAEVIDAPAGHQCSSRFKSSGSVLASVIAVNPGCGMMCCPAIIPNTPHPVLAGHPDCGAAALDDCAVAIIGRNSFCQRAITFSNPNGVANCQANLLFLTGTGEPQHGCQK
jgi:hypothetical protein